MSGLSSADRARVKQHLGKGSATGEPERAGKPTAGGLSEGAFKKPSGPCFPSPTRAVRSVQARQKIGALFSILVGSRLILDSGPPLRG